MARLGLEVLPSPELTPPRIGAPRVHMRGAPHGRPVVLEYELTEGGWGAARLAVTLEHPAPRFRALSAHVHMRHFAGEPSGLPP